MTFLQYRELTPHEARELMSVGFVVKFLKIINKFKDLYEIWVQKDAK